MTPSAASTETATALRAADDLAAAGRWTEVVEVLTEANRRTADADLEVRLVDARHRAFAAAPGSEVRDPWPPPVADLFPDCSGIPEIDRSDLTSQGLASALAHHGSLVVRGLLAEEEAGRLRSLVDQTFAAADAAATGASVAETAPWYVPFEPAEGYDFGWVERHFSRNVGAVLAVEAPRALFNLIEALRSSGVVDAIAGYVGEHPALSAKKTSLRRARPDSPTEWHQDGSFLGEGIRTVNVWTALTPCGTAAPSIDVFARPFRGIVETGTDDALFSWSVSPEQAERLDTADVVRPSFQPGDALLFNQLTLHRTGLSTEMTDERLAIESWFFAPSTYPYEQVPLAF